MESKLKNGFDCIGVTIVFFCHDGKGNVLMAKRSTKARDEHGRWDIGGGALEFDKTVEATLRSEIEEEYQTKVLDYQFLGYRDVHRINNDQPTHWIALDFKVLVDKARVKNGEPHKFDEIGWFSRTTLPNELHSQLPIFLNNYVNQLWD